MPTHRQKLLRWPHRILLGITLLLTGALLIAWPLSHLYAFYFHLDTGPTTYLLGAYNGRLFAKQNHPIREPEKFSLQFEFQPNDDPSPRWAWSYLTGDATPPHFLVFECGGITWAKRSDSAFRSLRIPFSYLTLPLLIYPALTYRHYKKHRHLHPTRAFPLEPSNP